MANLIPVTVTTTMAESSPYQENTDIQFASESMRHGDAQLHVNWQGHVQFVCPGTWTIEERKHALLEMGAKMARTWCILIIQSLPQPVVVDVFPQLRSLAEHEMKMWYLL